MFNSITKSMKDRMNQLEEWDQKDRQDGTPRMQRLRQIPAETGKFLALMALSSPKGNMVEIGTSAGYSTLWLSLAAKERKQKIETMELLPEKIRLAKETFQLAKVTEFIDLREGDALKEITKMDEIAFCFLDFEKELYMECYQKIIPRLIQGGILICDNAINHKETLQPLIDFALSDKRVDTVLLTIGKGELVCRKRYFG